MLGDIIEQYRFNYYEVTYKAIRNRLSSTNFLCAGLRHNVNEITSIEDLDIA